MAAKNPHTGEQHRATDAALLAQQAEETAIVPGTIQPQSANTAKPNGNGQAKGPFMMPHAWEREAQSSDPHAPEASLQDRPITKGDAWRALGTLKAEIAGGLAVLGVCYWIFHTLLSSGWINTPVNNTTLQAVTMQQGQENSWVHNEISAIKGTLTTQSVALGNLNGLMLKQAEATSRIEGYLAGALSSASATASPLPLAFQKSGKLSLSTNIATSGWTAKQSDD